MHQQFQCACIQLITYLDTQEPGVLTATQTISVVLTQWGLNKAIIMQMKCISLEENDQF